MKKILVISPHADDETLGCGGTLLWHLSHGDETHWLLVTGVAAEYSFSHDKVAQRRHEIATVSKKYQFSSVHQLSLPPAALETLPLGDIIEKISEIVKVIQPHTVYVPFRNDAHTDHQIVFDASMSATKSFRYPFIRKVMAYETLSETDFGLKPENSGFRPNIYIDIEGFLNEKIEILNIFESEMGAFPFPRSEKAVSALASIRGVQCGCNAAEAFMLIKEVIK